MLDVNRIAHLRLVFCDYSDQRRKAIPGDLHTDAKGDEGNYTQDAVGRRGRDGFGYSWRIGIANINCRAKDEDGDQQTEVTEDVVFYRSAGESGAEGQHGDQGARARGDWKCEWVEGLIVQVPRIGCLIDLDLFALAAGTRFGVLLVQHRPSNARDHYPARNLNDGQRDTEEIENRRSQEFDDGQKNDVVDRNLAGERPINFGGDLSNNTKEDERRSQRIDERQQSAERN